MEECDGGLAALPRFKPATGGAEREYMNASRNELPSPKVESQSSYEGHQGAQAVMGSSEQGRRHPGAGSSNEGRSVSPARWV
jgi:hypothetical protein